MDNVAQCASDQVGIKTADVKVIRLRPPMRRGGQTERYVAIPFRLR